MIPEATAEKEAERSLRSEMERKGKKREGEKFECAPATVVAAAVAAAVVTAASTEVVAAATAVVAAF